MRTPTERLAKAVGVTARKDPAGAGQFTEQIKQLDVLAVQAKLNGGDVRRKHEGDKVAAAVEQMAVDQRNWLRKLWRSEVMKDQTNAKILYLRDLGLQGSRDGMTLQQVIAKVIKGLQKVDAKTQQAALANDFKFENATPEQLTQIYQGVIGSAGQTNAGVNASTGAKKEELKDTKVAQANVTNATNVTTSTSDAAKTDESKSELATPVKRAVDMNGAAHTLIATPGPNPKIEMASLRAKVSQHVATALASTKDEAQRKALRDIGNKAAHIEQILRGGQTKSEARQLEPSLAGAMGELGALIFAYSQSYGVKDFQSVAAGRLTELKFALESTLKTESNRAKIVEQCHRLGAAHGALVQLSDHLATGISTVEFIEKTPPSGGKAARFSGQIAAIGKGDAALKATMGKGNSAEFVEKSRNGDVNVLANTGPESMAANPAFEEDAKAFEDKFAKLAWTHGAQGADALAAKAQAYLLSKSGGAWDAANVELGKLLKQIGVDDPSWSGAVGKEVKNLMGVFNKGNIAEKMCHVGNFFIKILGNDLLAADTDELGQRLTECKFNVARVLQRQAEMLKKKEQRNDDGKPWDISPVDSDSPVSGQLQTRGDRGEAFELPENDANKAKRADLTRSDRTLTQTGVTMTKRQRGHYKEKDQAWDVENEPVKTAEGTKVWIMNERNKWVQWQRQLSLPIGAGPSGSTNQLMRAGEALGVNLLQVRTSCIAYILPEHHHTLVEILAAAAAFGCHYTAGQKMYRSIAPFTKGQLQACGKDGKFPDETHGDESAANMQVRFSLTSRAQ